MQPNDNAKIASPCVSICALNEDDICIGCFRTGEEILSWRLMTNDEKKKVLAQLEERARKLGATFS